MYNGCGPHGKGRQAGCGFDDCSRLLVVTRMNEEIRDICIKVSLRWTDGVFDARHGVRSLRGTPTDFTQGTGHFLRDC